MAVRVYSPTTATPAFPPAGRLVSAPSVAVPGRGEYRLALGLTRRLRRDVADFGPDLARPARHDGAGILHEVVHALSVYSGPSWSATEIELVSSRLGEGRSGGALHETVATIPFAPGS